MIDLFIIDSVVFLLAMVACCVVFWRQTRENKALRPFGWIYIVATFSSYNIMIKPVHDYNVVIPRTFMTHAKILGPLCPLDILMVFIALYAVFRRLTQRGRYPLIPREYRLVFAKDLVLMTISLILFLFLMDRTGSPLGNEVSTYRQLIYYVALFSVCATYVRREQSANVLKVFLPFLTVDLFNFVSGFISTFVYGDLAWQRYLLNVTIIDQDDLIIAIVYPLILVFMWVKRSTFQMGSFALVGTLAITLLLLANFYKGSIAIIAIFLPFLIILAVIKRQDIMRPIMVLVGLLPFVAIFAWIFLILYSTAPLQTRSGQFVDLANYMEKLGSAIPYVGMGNGTFYERNFNEEDQGEAKKIDLEEAENKAVVMQSPVAQIYKSAGIFGLIVHILVFLAASVHMISKVVVNHPISAASGYLVCMLFIMNFFFFDPTGTTAFGIAKLYIFMTICRRASKHV